MAESFAASLDEVEDWSAKCSAGETCTAIAGVFEQCAQDNTILATRHIPCQTIREREDGVPNAMGEEAIDNKKSRNVGQFSSSNFESRLSTSRKFRAVQVFVRDVAGATHVVRSGPDDDLATLKQQIALVMEFPLRISG